MGRHGENYFDVTLILLNFESQNIYDKLLIKKFNTSSVKFQTHTEIKRMKLGCVCY